MCPLAVRRNTAVSAGPCLVSRQVGNSHLLLGFDTASLTARSSQRRPTADSGHQMQCRVDCRERILWLETFFLDNAARRAAALHDAAADVVMVQRAAGHDSERWQRD